MYRSMQLLMDLLSVDYFMRSLRSVRLQQTLWTFFKENEVSSCCPVSKMPIQISCDQKQTTFRGGFGCQFCAFLLSVKDNFRET